MKSKSFLNIVFIAVLLMLILSSCTKTTSVATTLSSTMVNGEQLYAVKCTKCHDPIPPNSWRTVRTADELVGLINSGPGNMPAFSDTLTAEQIDAIVRYIQR